MSLWTFRTFWNTHSCSEARYPARCCQGGGDARRPGGDAKVCEWTRGKGPTGPRLLGGGDAARGAWPACSRAHLGPLLLALGGVPQLLDRRPDLLGLLAGGGDALADGPSPLLHLAAVPGGKQTQVTLPRAPERSRAFVDEPKTLPQAGSRAGPGWRPAGGARPREPSGAGAACGPAT